MSNLTQWEEMDFIARENNGVIEIFCRIGEGGPGTVASNTWTGWISESHIQERRRWARPLTLGKKPPYGTDAPVTFVHGHYAPTPLRGQHEETD